MLDSVKRKCWMALLLYSEGYTPVRACAQLRLSTRDFYGLTREDPKYAEEYQSLRNLRADSLLDGCEDILAYELDAKQKRVRIESILKMIGQLNRGRYGDRLAVAVETPPSIMTAITAARSRAMLPGYDLAPDAEGIYQVESTASTGNASDQKSGVEPTRPELAPAYVPPDPFE